MKTLMIPLATLAACSRATPIDEQHAAIITQIDALESSLTTECKTEGILGQINAIRTQLSTEVSVCHASVREEQIKREKANILLGITTILMVLFGFGYFKRVGSIL